VIVWTKGAQSGISGNQNICGQRFDKDGKRSGSNFKINEAGTGSWLGNPGLAMDYNGDYIVTWVVMRNDTMDIYGQLYKDNKADGNNFKINSLIDSSQMFLSNVVMDKKGNFAVFWSVFIGGGQFDMACKMYSSQSIQAGDTGTVVTVGKTFRYSIPAISTTPEEGKFMVVAPYIDTVDGQIDVVIKYVQNGVLSDESFELYKMHRNYANEFRAASYDLASSDNSVGFVWTDSKREKGLDIYGSLYSWDTETKITERTPHKNNMVFNSNYSYVKIYDLYGRSISGHKDLGSGIYFMVGKNNVVKKQVLIK
jgi:hypothetical protein